MRLGKTLLKLLISAGLLYLVLRQIDTEQLIATLRSADPLYLLLSLLLYHASKIVSALRLGYYFADAGVGLSVGCNLRLYYLGMFYNLFLPGGIGGDGYKIYLLKRHRGGGVKELVQATLIDRISGLVALLFLAALLFLFSDYAERFAPLRYAALATLILIYPIFLYLHRRLFPTLSRSLAATTILGFIVQLLQLASAWALLKALGIDDHIPEYLTLFLISSIVAVLPITFGGVGAREATFLYGLRLIGLDPATGVAFSFLFFLVSVAASAVGIAFVNIAGDLADPDRCIPADRGQKEQRR